MQSGCCHGGSTVLFWRARELAAGLRPPLVSCPGREVAIGPAVDRVNSNGAYFDEFIQPSLYGDGFKSLDPKWEASGQHQTRICVETAVVVGRNNQPPKETLGFCADCIQRQRGPG